MVVRWWRHHLYNENLLYLLSSSGTRPTLPMVVAPEAMAEHLFPVIDSKNFHHTIFLYVKLYFSSGENCISSSLRWHRELWRTLRWKICTFPRVQLSYGPILLSTVNTWLLGPTTPLKRRDSGGTCALVGRVVLRMSEMPLHVYGWY
jgi:hypothetical protein